MMTLMIAAAAVAAQPSAAPMQQGQMPAMQHEQHEGMKSDCCKDCCKDMAGKHEGHGAERGTHAQ